MRQTRSPSAVNSTTLTSPAGSSRTAVSSKVAIASRAVAPFANDDGCAIASDLYADRKMTFVMRASPAGSLFAVPLPACADTTIAWDGPLVGRDTSTRYARVEEVVADPVVATGLDPPDGAEHAIVVAAPTAIGALSRNTT